MALDHRSYLSGSYWIPNGPNYADLSDSMHVNLSEQTDRSSRIPVFFDVSKKTESYGLIAIVDGMKRQHHLSNNLWLIEGICPPVRSPGIRRDIRYTFFARYNTQSRTGDITITPRRRDIEVAEQAERIALGKSCDGSTSGPKFY